MTDNVLVKIQCLVYNHEKYLRQCLDGFVMQKTNFKFEAIVHDDVSTDNSVAIIREYAEKYPDIIKPIYEVENQYSKGNRSLSRIMDAACTAKYVALCEGDDYWIDENKLQKQVDFLESHPDYSMCFCKSKIVNETNNPICLHVDLIESRDYSSEEIFKNWIIPTASVLFRREVFDFPVKEDWRYLNGDIICWLKCAELGKIRGFADEMCVYRVQNSGVTYDLKRRAQRFLKYPLHYQFIKENFTTLPTKVINDAIARSFLQRIQYQEKLKDKLADFLTAFKYSFRLPIKHLWKFIKRIPKKILKKSA